MTRKTIKDLESEIRVLKEQLAEERVRGANQATTIAQLHKQEEEREISVAEHMADCKRIDDVLGNANTLATRLTVLLHNQRLMLHKLVSAQHDLVKVDVPFQMKDACEGQLVISSTKAVEVLICQINNILGDQ